MPDEVWNTQGELVSTTPTNIVTTMPAAEFQSLFTDVELVAIQTSIDANVIRLRTWIQTIREDVRFDDVRVTNGLMYLQAIGILTEQRREAILNA